MDRRFKFTGKGVFEKMPDGTEREVTGAEVRHDLFGYTVSELREAARESLTKHVEAEHPDAAEEILAQDLEILLTDETDVA